MSSKAKKNLRERLNRYRAKPHSAAYHTCYKDAKDAGIPLPSAHWQFPDPVAADDGAAAAAAAAAVVRPEGGGGGGGVQPADPDAARVAAERERERIKKAKQRAKKKQKVAEENAGSDRRAFQDVTNAQKLQAYRDRARILREDFAADPDRAVRAVALLVKSPDFSAATLEAAKKIKPLPFELAENMRVVLAHVGRGDENSAMKTVMCSAVVKDGVNVAAAARTFGLSRERVAQSVGLRKEVMTGQPRRIQSKQRRRRRRDRFSEETREVVREWWHVHTRPSTCTKDMRYPPRTPVAERVRENMHVLHFADVSDEKMFEKFTKDGSLSDAQFTLDDKNKSPAKRPCLTVFLRLKPWYVVPLNLKRRKTCCCEIHTRMNYMMRGACNFAREMSHRHDGSTSRGHFRRGASVGVAAATAAAGGGSVTQDRAVVLEHLRNIAPLLECSSSPTRFLNWKPATEAGEVGPPRVLCQPIKSTDGEFEYAPLDCVRGVCEKCGDVVVRKILDSLVALSEEGDFIHFTDWQQTETQIDKVGKSKTKKEVGTTMLSLSPKDFAIQLMDALFGERTTDKAKLKKLAEGIPLKEDAYWIGPQCRNLRSGFVWHAFEARILSHMMVNDFKRFPIGELRMGTDFAMNFTVDNDDAPQAEHWAPTQVTIYSVVIYVHAKDSTPEAPNIETIHYHVLSDDMTHDAHAVRHFHEAIFKDLAEKGYTFTKCAWWSDGAAEHFKSTNALVDMHQHAPFKTGGIPLVRLFGCTSHMKGAWDGANTYVKHSLRKYLLTDEAKHEPGKGIRTAEEACKWCAENLSKVVGKHSNKESRRSATKLNRREFLFVGRKDTKRDGTLAKLEWVTKDRIQALHELRLVPGTVDLKGRDLACRCPPCQGTSPGECRYRAWVDAPRHVSIQLKTNMTGEQLRERCKCRTGREPCLICAYVEDVSRRLESGSEPA